MLVSGDGWEYWELLLLTDIWSGLSWSARLLMALALLAVLTLLEANTGLTMVGRL